MGIGRGFGSSLDWQHTMVRSGLFVVAAGVAAGSHIGARRHRRLPASGQAASGETTSDQHPDLSDPRLARSSTPIGQPDSTGR